MRSEETNAAYSRRYVVKHGLSNGDAIVRGGAATELVEDDEGTGRCFGENLLRFGKLDEEGRLRGEDIVICT